MGGLHLVSIACQCRLGAVENQRPGLFERSEFPGRPEQHLSGTCMRLREV